MNIKGILIKGLASNRMCAILLHIVMGAQASRPSQPQDAGNTLGKEAKLEKLRAARLKREQEERDRLAKAGLLDKKYLIKKEAR